jgi:hypothetical protein
MTMKFWDAIQHGSRFPENGLKKVDPGELEPDILNALEGH